MNYFGKLLKKEIIENEQQFSKLLALYSTRNKLFQEVEKAMSAEKRWRIDCSNRKDEAIEIIDFISNYCTCKVIEDEPYWLASLGDLFFMEADLYDYILTIRPIFPQGEGFGILFKMLDSIRLKQKITEFPDHYSNDLIISRLKELDLWEDSRVENWIIEVFENVLNADYEKEFPFQWFSDSKSRSWPVLFRELPKMVFATVSEEDLPWKIEISGLKLIVIDCENGCMAKVSSPKK